MSSYKDTFESDTFKANTFACGTWRGTGVTPASDAFLCGKVTVVVTYTGTVKIQPTNEGLVTLNEC